jgi:hypothetical protein
VDADLATLYGVTTGALNRAVRRNTNRFPADFMFQLTVAEAENLKCQIGISSFGHGGRRRSLLYAFTEQGVAMLSSVLRSERAVQVNVAIMRAFVNLRRMLAGNKALARKLAEMERRLEGHDANWEDPHGVIWFNSDLPLAELGAGDFLQNTRTYLHALSVEDGTGATATGNLNRVFVRRMFEQLKLSASFRASTLCACNALTC